MRNFVIFFSLLFLCGELVVAQKLSGKIENLQNNQIYVVSSDNYITYRRDTLLADKNGYFKVTLDKKKAGFITLKGKGFNIEDIYIYPNSDLEISADANSIYSTRHYSGSAAVINNFYADIHKSQLLRDRGFDSKTYKLAEKEFISAINSYFQTRDTLKSKYFNKVMKNEQRVRDFLYTDSVDMLYFKGGALLSYLYRAVNKDDYYSDYIKPLEKFTADDRMIASSRYRYFWMSLLDDDLTEIRKTLKDDVAKTAAPYYEFIPQLIENKLSGEIRKITARAYIENITANYASSTEGTEIIDGALQKLFNLVGDTSYLTKQKAKLLPIRQFKEISRKVGSFKPFNAVDSAGKHYSLEDFKGKTIYVDLWASWCAPCINEFKYVENLLTGMAHSEKFVYLTISIDEDKASWLKALRNHKPSGTHLWMAGGLKSPLVDYYKIKSIPHYLLIGEDGKLLKYAAPKPSDREEIEKIVNKQ
jgi:thiol-disulfide isomerase/thioredoxin